MNTIIYYPRELQLLGAPRYLINDRQYAYYGFFLTIILAVLFTYLQVIEYLTHLLIFRMVFMVLPFSCDRVSWIHVIIGTIFIVISFYRYINFTSTYAYFGFEAASWYWHFVDVIWLFLFHNIYLGQRIKKINFSFTCFMPKREKFRKWLKY